MPRQRAPIPGRLGRWKSFCNRDWKCCCEKTGRAVFLAFDCLAPIDYASKNFMTIAMFHASSREHLGLFLLDHRKKTRIMPRALTIPAVMALLLAYQVGSCQAAATSYTRSWSTTVTTTTSSTSSTRRVTSSPTRKNTSISSPACPIPPSVAKPVIRKVGKGANDHNCVLYLRQQRGIKLPAQNLTTYASKVSIINSPVPHEKSVAIIKTPGRNAGIGHVAEVTGLELKDGKVTMRLAEANNPSPGYYERTITGKNLEEIQKNANIVGYYVEPYETVESHETVNAQGAPASRYF